MISLSGMENGGTMNVGHLLNISRTVNVLNILTPQKFVVTTLKFELCGSTIE